MRRIAARDRGEPPGAGWILLIARGFYTPARHRVAVRHCRAAALPGRLSLSFPAAIRRGLQTSLRRRRAPPVRSSGGRPPPAARTGSMMATAEPGYLRFPTIHG